MELDSNKRTMEDHDGEVRLLTLKRWRRMIKKNHDRQLLLSLERWRRMIKKTHSQQIAIEITEAQAVMNKIGPAQEEQETTLRNLTGQVSTASAPKKLEVPGTSSTSSAPSSSSDYTWIGVDSLTGSRQQETGRPGFQPSPCPQRLPKGSPTPATRKLSPGFSKSKAAAEAKSVDSDTSEELRKDKSDCQHEWTEEGVNQFCDKGTCHVRKCRLCNLRKMRPSQLRLLGPVELQALAFIHPQALQEARVAKKEHKNLVNQKVGKIAAQIQKESLSK